MVSVCLASYNGERFILQQINSILSEIRSGDELVISDDGSTDGTIEIIRSINDSRIKLIYGNFHDFRLNFENAMKHARGEYIFLADQDDIWLEGKYRHCLSLLQTYDLVVTDSIMTDENLNTIEPSFFKYYNCGKGIIKNMLRSTYFGSCMAFRSSLLRWTLPLPRTVEIGHDLWTGMVAEITGSVFFSPQPYLLYRRHGNTICTTSQNYHIKSNRNLWMKIRGRLIMAYYVLQFYINYKRR